MSLYIVVSGPQSQAKKALRTLEDEGYQPVLDRHGKPLDHDWGHPPDGKGHVQFWTVQGDDVDRVVGLLEPLRWRLRAHFDAPEPWSEPTAAEKLAALGLTADDLRSVLGV